jgi:imidazole glycerol-phosphate synthase subunit HisH
MRVVLIDSGGANIGSVRYALERLGVDAALTGNADEIRRAERVILPGVGAAAPAMARLRELDLVDTIRTLEQPLLGICLGMQLLFERSEEGEVECLGLLPGRVRALAPGAGIRVPHMGWNRLRPRRASRLLEGIDDGAQAYFVHSYAAPAAADCIASSTHGDEFAAVVERGRVAGAQFHPERSAAVGARLLRNFLDGAAA